MKRFIRKLIVTQQVLCGLGVVLCGVVITPSIVHADNIGVNKSLLNQEKHQVSGIVTDENNNPIAGVLVSILGTTTGDVTRANGEYNVDVATGGILNFSFIGYKTHEVKVGTESIVSIKLEVETLIGDEVVVVGYGTKSRASLTGAVSVIKSEDIIKQSSGNILSALQGAVPGVTVTREAGGFAGGSGGKTGIEMRGATSIHGSEALIIIDGIPVSYENFELMNPSDVENITFLKDAAAAIYGARAAGGVILVTTKRGSSDKPLVTFSSRYSLKAPGISVKKVTTAQHIQMYDEGSINDGQPNHFFSHLVGKEMDGSWQKGPFPDTPDFWMGQHDWGDTMFGTAHNFNQDLSVSGQTDRSNYMLSLGYLGEGSLIKFGEHSNKRYSIRTNYEYEVSDILTLGAKMSYTLQDMLEPSQLSNSIGAASLSYSSMPMYNQNGDYYSFGGFVSPIGWAEEGGTRDLERNLLEINLSAELDLAKGLKLIGRYGMVKGHSFIKSHVNTWYGYNKDSSIKHTYNNRTSAANEQNLNTYQNLTVTLNYDKTFNEIHKIDILAGYSDEQNIFENFSASRLDMLSSSLHTLNLGSTEEQFNNGAANDWALRSFFGRAGYSLKDRYFFDATVRADGTSKFIQEKRWGTFYGASAAWLITNESFMEDQNIFSNLKIRASIGQSGNQNGIGLYDHTQLITPIKNNVLYPFGDEAGKIPSYNMGAMVSKERTWEVVTSNNIGLDFGFLEGRLNGSFEYYLKENDNMLIGITYPTILGATAPATNSGKLKTWGWEFNVGWRDKVGDFTYYVNANISDSKNKLVNLDGADSYNAGNVAHREGYPIGSWFTWESGGIIQSEAELAEYKKMPGVSQSIHVGDYKYLDVDGNGKLDAFGDKTKGEEGDLVFQGDGGLHYLYSFNFGGSWRGFDLSATFQGVGQWKIQEFGGVNSPVYHWWNQSLEHFYGNTWSEDNRGAKYPRLSAFFGDTNSWNYDMVANDKLIDAWYLRLKAVRLGYTLPSHWIDGIGLKNAKIYLSGNDLWETSNLADSYDPEAGTNSNFFPFSRYYSVGIDIQF